MKTITTFTHKSTFVKTDIDTLKSIENRTNELKKLIYENKV